MKIVDPYSQRQIAAESMGRQKCRPIANCNDCSFWQHKVNLCRYSRGFLGDVASNDSGIIESVDFQCLHLRNLKQEMCCRKETARCRSAVVFGLKTFAVNIHYKFKSSQASKSQASELQTYRRKTEFNAK